MTNVFSMSICSGNLARYFLCFLLLFCLVPDASSQSDTGVLFGVITDPAARTVVGAHVSLRHNSTGATREYVTDDRGVYFFTFLPPGVYTVQFQADGFKQYQDADIRIQVAQVTRVDVEMAIGSVKEVLDVSGASRVLSTDSASQGTVVGQEKIAALPLNGRQFIQLALLVPGANPGGRAVQQNGIRQGQIGGLSVGGGRTNNTMFLLDGAMNTDLDYSTLNYSPSIDGISEFQVQTAMVAAEYARSTVNVVTKSGGNEFHGSVFEFVRNRNFDSRPFNLNQSKLPKYQRNQFGGTFGGPIVKEKLFNFFSYEGLRIRQAAPGLTSVLVPTAEQRQGDFSRSTPAGIFDPLTLTDGVRQPFPGNRIPATRMNPLALAALKVVPLPNGSSASLFENTTGVLRQDADNFSNRVDYTLRETWTVFGRYSISEEKADIPATITGRDRINNARAQSAVLGSTKVLTSNLLNETRLSFSRQRILNGLPELSFDVNGQQQALPQFILAPYPIMGGSGAFNNTRGGGTIQVRNNNYQIYDNVAWHRGRHNFKFGGEIFHVQYNRFESPSTLGDFQFTSGFTTRTARADGTGDALASYLLGLPAVASRAIGPSRIDGRQWSYSLYAQDDFRISSKLVLNLGIRYELSPPMYDQHQQMSSIDYRNVPSPQSVFAEGRTAFYKPTLFICGQSGTPRGCAYTDRNNFAPRLGIVYSLDEKTVVRTGFGMFYAGNDLNPLFRLAAGLPGNIAQTLNSDNFIPRFQNFDVFGPAIVGPVQIQAAGIDLFQRTSYAMQWNFSLQREVAKDIVVEAGYLANIGLKLEQNVQPNNALPGTGAIDPRRPYAGLEYAPGTVFPSYLSVSGNSVPAGFINYLPHSAQSNYHAALLRVEKRFDGNSSLLSSYTFSKAITNAPQFRNAGGADGSENSPAQDAFNLSADRGLASFHVKHRWVNSFVYGLPFGPEKAFFNEGLSSKILGGWQASGIYTMQSGFPFTVNLQGDTAGVGAGTGGIFIRPNAVAGQSWELPGDQRSTNRYFNTGAFAAPPAAQFGNIGKNTVIGPGLVNLDFVLAKNISLGETKKLQFRAEAFNIMNHSNYSIVGRLLNTPTFGRVLGQLDPRQIQFGAKFLF
jgi:hypothetical protein